MNEKTWQKAKELFHTARSLPTDQRPAFLDEHCASDAALREQVDELLRFYDSEFLESPPLMNADKLLDNDNFAPGRVIGRYHIRELIGTGGMGQVFLADDVELNRPVAFKVLHEDVAGDKERVRRFIQEARAASALNHPNILTIYEIGTFETARFIVSEYIDGETLRDRMRGGLTSAESIDIMCQVATALQAAHAAGIVHRDIKPENIMLRRDGLVKVLDFGLAKLTENRHGDAETQRRSEEDNTLIAACLRPPVPVSPHTQPGLIMGTVAYMSPEQARGQAVDARTDLWSLGVVFHEMLTGRSPFEGESASELITSILSRDGVTANTASLPQQLTPICQKALSKDRKTRYQSAHDLLNDLQAEKKRMEYGIQLTPFISATSTDDLKTQSIRRRPTLSAEYVVTSVKRHKYISLTVLAAVLFVAIGLSAYSYNGAPRADSDKSQEGLVNVLPDEAAGSWTPTGPMPASQGGHTATLLPSGKVLVTGGGYHHSDIGAYLYDPVTNTWSTTGNRLTPRNGFTATLLTNGKVLVAGGINAGGTLATAELYDYTTGSWTATGSMPNVHIGHTATVLSNGKVLVASGQNNIPGCCYLGMVSASEIYDPVSGTWTSTGAVSDARNSHIVSLLPDGKVLIAGGGNLSDVFASAEIFDPATGVWSPTSSLSMPRSSGTGITLGDGSVLFAGGCKVAVGCFAVSNGEIYDPASATWSLTSAMGAVRNFHTAALMADGKVLVAGGHSPYGVVTPTAEIYDPVLNSWSSIPNMLTQRYSSTATLLADGRVLVTGGDDGSGGVATAEVYTPGPPDSPAQCPAGKYNNADGCVDAEPGYFVPAPGATSQFPCPAGSYQPGGGATSCVLALPMSFVPMSGSASQTRCAPGYASAAGATVCTTTPQQSVHDLINAVNNMGLPNGVANSLNAPLNNIDLNNLSTGCGKLGAFLNQVDTKQTNDQLTVEQANQFRQQANAIKAQIGCAQRETGTGNNSP